MEMAGMHRMATEVIVILAGSMIFFGGFGFGGFSSAGGYGQNGYGRSNAGADDEESVYFRGAALNYISSGHYKRSVECAEQYSAAQRAVVLLQPIANQGLGNNARLNRRKKATEMEPQNAEYAGWQRRMRVRRQLVIPDDRRAVWWNAGIQWRRRILLEALSGKPDLQPLLWRRGLSCGGMPAGTISFTCSIECFTERASYC